MRVFVGGASGAIGRPIIAELIRQGHTVTGMTRSETGARQLAALGAVVLVRGNVFMGRDSGRKDHVPNLEAACLLSMLRP